jgi:hypothetical protein
MNLQVTVDGLFRAVCTKTQESPDKYKYARGRNDGLFPEAIVRILVPELLVEIEDIADGEYIYRKHLGIFLTEVREEIQAETDIVVVLRHAPVAKLVLAGLRIARDKIIRTSTGIVVGAIEACFPFGDELFYNQ